MPAETENKSEVPDKPQSSLEKTSILERILVIFKQMDTMSVIGGIGLAVGFIALSTQITQSTTVGVLNHELSPVFVTLYISLSTGHYLGRAVTGSNSNFVDGVFGIFLVFSFVVIYWSLVTDALGLPIALLGIILGLVMAHHRGWIQENKWVATLVEIFGRGIVPLGIVGAILVEVILPLIYKTNLVKIVGSLDDGVLLILLAISSLLIMKIDSIIEAL